MDSLSLERLLVSMERLDIHNYRTQAYLDHPNEASSACPQIASSKKKKKTPRKKQQQQQQQQQNKACRSGSTNSAEVHQEQQRKDANDRKKTVNFMLSHCALESTKNDEVVCSREIVVVDAPASRMRGGGSGEFGFFKGDTDFTWRNAKFAMASRLEGGGCGGETYPVPGCCGKGRKANNDFQWENITPGYMAANKCKLKLVEKADHPVCTCPDRDALESVLKKKGHGVCMKKPCLGTECLIKAFKDAQDFVDNIGKVPGLAGLGITESPYFGANKCQEQKEVKRAESKGMSTSKPAEPSSLCNPQNLENLKKLSFNKPSNTFAPSATKKAGVVQEGPTTFPDPSTYSSLKTKKKDEKIEKSKDAEISNGPPEINEDTPCGEPKCKSRPKKPLAECDESSAEKVGEKVSSAQKFSARSHPSPGAGTGASKSAPKMNKPTKANQFIYTFGNTYPTSVYGHKNCNMLRARVPAHMGWMWNQTDTIANLKPRAGWRPGAISVTLRDIMREAKAGFFKEAHRPASAPSRGKKGKLQKATSFTAKKNACNEEETEEEIEYPPTLHIHRKDGVYYVTMYPIRQDTSDEPRLDEPINPLQFKIVKSKGSIATSSTASDMEIEFSPPAAVNRPKKKPNVVHVETQVRQQEIVDTFRKTSTDSKDGKGKKDKGKKK